MLTTPLFTKIRESEKKIIILQGGGDAGKTVTALQYLAVQAVSEPNCIVTVTGQDLPNLKRGAITSFQNYVLPSLRSWVRSYNQQETTYYFKNGSKIEFKAFGNEMDARGSERHYLFMNEANSQSWNMFWQLQRKTRKKVILDYNPTAEFWVHENIIKGRETQFNGKWHYIQVDHRHNPFLSQDEHDAYETISDTDLFKVYARGETGKISGLIFGHFKEAQTIPTDCDRYIWGIDYGYTNDQTALVKVGIKGRQRYFQELCYEPGLSAEHIKQLLDNNGRQPHETLYSEIDKEMILQLRKLGVLVTQAKKGPGSRVAGISKMKEYECFYIGENYRREVLNYKYVTVTDQLTGKTILTNEPMDGNDHLCFVGGTKIETTAGLISIENITLSHIAITSLGTRKIVSKMHNGFAEVTQYNLKFDSIEVNLECTPNHKIKTLEGWVPISQLKEGMGIFLSKNLTAKNTIYTQEKGISPRATKECTLKCGSSIMGLFKKVITFITKMKTRITTISKISNVSTVKNIVQCTCKKETCSHISKDCANTDTLQMNGANLNPEGNGIKSMQNVQDSAILNTENVHANVVGLNTLLKSQTKNTVHLSAEVKKEETIRLTTLSGFVYNAMKLLKLINISQQQHAHFHVLQSIDGQSAEKQLVYDLEIEDVHEYFANGVLVHNCQASIYACYTDSFIVRAGAG